MKYDDQVDRALQLFDEYGSISCPLLQRKMKISYESALVIYNLVSDEKFRKKMNNFYTFRRERLRQNETKCLNKELYEELKKLLNAYPKDVCCNVLKEINELYEIKCPETYREEVCC